MKRPMMAGMVSAIWTAVWAFIASSSALSENPVGADPVIMLCGFPLLGALLGALLGLVDRAIMISLPFPERFRTAINSVLLGGVYVYGWTRVMIDTSIPFLLLLFIAGAFNGFLIGMAIPKQK